MLTGLVNLLMNIVVAFEPQAQNDFDEMLTFLAVLSEKFGFTV